MIGRSWRGRVPATQGDAFHAHLLRTGVAAYCEQPGCLDVHLWRREADGWAHFLLLSTWTHMDAVRAYAGDNPERAVLYPGDAELGLVPDLAVEHFDVLRAPVRS